MGAIATSGHEDRFRRLFAQESEARLSRLSEQLLALEERGQDADLLASLFREAHTLKGGAAVVGFPQIARAAHALEDVLDELRRTGRPVTSGVVDVLLHGVDVIRAMVPASLEGRDESAAAERLEEAVRDVLEGHLGTPSTPAFDRAAGDSAHAPAAASDVGKAHDEAVAVAPPAEAGSDPRAGEGRAGEGQAGDGQAGEPRAGGGQTGDGRAGDGRAGDTPPARAHDETVRVPVARLNDMSRLVSEAAAAQLRVGRVLADDFGADPWDVPAFRELGLLLNELQDRTTRARMVPVSTITEPLHRAVRDAARAQGKEAHWEVLGGDSELDRSVLEQLVDPLLQLVRNAVDHGIETPRERVARGKPPAATVRLHAMQLGSEVVLVVADDGRGIDRERVLDVARARGVDVREPSDDDLLYVIFTSGLSTAPSVTDTSGRGVGLDVVRTALDRIRGRVEVRSRPGHGTEFRLVVPITLAMLPCLLVACEGRRLALPLHSVVTALPPAADGGDEVVDGRPVVWSEGRPVPVASLARTLDIGEGDGGGPAVVVGGTTRLHAFRVDALEGQRDVVVKGLSRLLPRLDVIAGASVEPDGSILLVLDPPGIIDAARRTVRPVPAATSSTSRPREGAGTRGTVLVVDDALTVRELQRSILERAGYEVRAVADGVDALAELAREPVDLVLTDVEMPRMDGFALVEAIRSRLALAGLPVVILTSRASEEDRRRGLEAGADAYVVKSAFDAAALLGTVERLLGARR